MEELDPRQLCNVVFAVVAEGKDRKQRDELLAELNSSLDPMEQWDQAMGSLPR